MKESRNPFNVHAPLGSYVHQIEIRGPERMLVLSGQVGQREDGFVPEDPIEQIGLALENIACNLRAANMEVKDLTKLTFYLVGEMDTVRRRAATAAFLQGHQPCMTLVYVVALAAPVYRVEIDAWASCAENPAS